MNRTIPRSLAPLLALLAFFVLAAASEASAAEGDPGEERKLILKVYALPNPRDVSVSAQAERAVVRAFHQKYPDIELRSYSGISIEGMGMDSAPLMAIAGGMSPDVLYVNFRQSHTYISQGFLEPLDQFVRPEQEEELYQDRVARPAWPVIRREGPQIQVVATVLVEREAPAEDEERKVFVYLDRNTYGGSLVREGDDVGLRQAAADYASRLALDKARKELEGQQVQGMEVVGMEVSEKPIWALPRSTLIRALQYRRDLFTEVGLDPDKPPRTWEELEEYARRLTQPDKGTFGLMFSRGPSAAWDWIGFLWSLGGDAVAQDEDGNWHAVFKGRAAAESLLFFVRLQTHRWTDASGQVQEGYVSKEAPQQANLRWLEGKIGMRLAYLEQDQIGRDIDPSVVGIAPVPLGYPVEDPETGEMVRLRGSELNCRMMGMFSDIRGRDGFTREEIQEAAWKWIWFVDSEEARRISTRVFVEAGYGRLYNPVYLQKYGYEEYLELVPENWLPTFQEALEHGKPEPYGKNCQSVYRFMTYPLTEALELAQRGRLGDTHEEQIATLKEILADAVARTNEEMIGIITPEERRRRNTVAAVVGMFMVGAFVFVLIRVWNTFRPPEADIHGGWGFRKYWPAYLIMLPAVLSILTWRYVPMLMGSRMVFQDYRVVGESQWVGLQNLADVLWDPTWWSAVWKTFYYMILMLGLGFWTPILLAILLTEVSAGKMAYRTIFYLPAVLSGMVVLYLWKLMYDPSDIGVLNQLLSHVGLSSQRWLDDPKLAMVCVVLPTIWASAGPRCLLYLAALKTVPDDLYEAADIDGCGFFGKVWHISLPTLKGLIIINFIGEFIIASQNTRMILVLTFGGPGESTKVAGLHIFERAYLLLRFGSATTMAWMLGIMMLGFTTIQLKRLSRMEFTTADQKNKM